MRVLAAFLLFAFAAQGATLEGRVVKVADGDTITVLDSTNGQHRVRLDKIDAPEKGQAFGEVSRRHLASFVAGKAVSVEYTKHDKYGRILGTVWADVANATGKVERIDVNLQMVADGLAWHYKYFDDTKSYAEAEGAARAAKRGLWRDKAPTPPWEFRRAKKRAQVPARITHGRNPVASRCTLRGRRRRARKDDVARRSAPPRGIRPHLPRDYTAPQGGEGGGRMTDYLTNFAASTSTPRAPRSSAIRKIPRRHSTVLIMSRRTILFSNSSSDSFISEGIISHGRA